MKMRAHLLGKGQRLVERIDQIGLAAQLKPGENLYDRRLAAAMAAAAAEATAAVY